jgi:hypothetical protein
MRFSDLDTAYSNKANFHSADLLSANLEDAELEGANFEHANLQYSRLQGSILKGASFQNAILTGVTFDVSTLKSLFSAGAIDVPFIEKKNYENTISRSIEFPPEYHQAGIAILNYFGKVLRDKYPEQKSKVNIEQEGLKVTMIVEAADGNKEEFEKALDEYGLVVQGQMAPENYFETPLQVSEFKHKAEMAAMEVRHTKELMYSEREQYKGRLISLEENNKFLQAQIRTLTDKNFQSLTKTLNHMAKSKKSNISDTLAELENLLSTAVQASDRKSVEEAVDAIEKKEPGTIKKLFKAAGIESVKGVAGSAGKTFWEWLKAGGLILS